MVIEDVANGMAELTGQYQNFSIIGKYLPILWILYTWSVLRLRPSPRGPRDDNRLTSRLCRVKVMLITIPFGFLRVYGPNVWRDINRYEDMLRSGKLTPKDEVGLIARVLPS